MARWDYFLVAVLGLLTAMTFLVLEHILSGTLAEVVVAPSSRTQAQ